MLSTKTPRATVGGLSPSKGYTVQIFELTGAGNVLLARREFVSKSPCSPGTGGCSRAPGRARVPFPVRPPRSLDA